VIFQSVVFAAMRHGMEVQAEGIRPRIKPWQEPRDPAGEQLLLILPNRTIRIVGGEGRLWQDVQAGEQPEGLVEIEVADVTTSFLVDQFQGQQTQQGRGGRNHTRTRITGLPDQFVKPQLCQQRPEREDARDAGLQRRRRLQKRAGSDVGDRSP
jgi:hypothetical protein